MIKEEFKNLTPEQIPAQIALYQEDERKGVQNFLLSQQKKVDKYYQEIERIENLCQYEKEYSQYDFICGIDEVGRGPLAGPVVAGAVVLPKGSRILYINDSKKLSAKKREELFDIMKLIPGAVTPLGILNDAEHRVQVFMDVEFVGNKIGVHPNDNTATVWMQADDLMKIIQKHGNTVEYACI